MRRRATTRLAGLVLGFGLLVSVQAAAQGGGDAGIPAGEIPAVLKARVGKPVTLILRSGKEYGGTVGEVCRTPDVARVAEPDPALAAALQPRFQRFQRLYEALRGEFR